MFSQTRCVCHLCFDLLFVLTFLGLDLIAIKSIIKANHKSRLLSQCTLAKIIPMKNDKTSSTHECDIQNREETSSQ